MGFVAEIPPELSQSEHPSLLLPQSVIQSSALSVTRFSTNKYYHLSQL